MAKSISFKLSNAGISSIVYGGEGKLVLERFTLIFQRLELDATVAGSATTSALLDWRGA